MSKVSQEINDPLLRTLHISSLQISSPNGTLADKNSFGDLSRWNCHLVQDFIWRQEKDLTSFSWPLTAQEMSFILFFPKSDIHYLGQGGAGRMWKDVYGVSKEMHWLCHCKELEMTALFWEQSVQEAETSGFHLCGAIVSSSLIHTSSTGTQILRDYQHQISVTVSQCQMDLMKNLPVRIFYTKVTAVIP